MGTSMIFRRPVSEIISERFFHSLALMLTAWGLSGIIGFTMGVISAMKKNTWVDRIIKWYCYTLASTPTFWMGLLTLIVFAVWLGWFPIGLGVPTGVLVEDVTIIDRIKHLILPAITLSIVGVANVALHTRQKLIDVLESDYVLFARARGEHGLCFGDTDYAILLYRRLPCNLLLSVNCLVEPCFRASFFLSSAWTGSGRSWFRGRCSSSIRNRYI